jgi:hypothetical protein
MQSRTFRKLACGAAIAAAVLIPGLAQTVATVHVDATSGHVINSFDPDQAIGSSIDNLNKNAIDKVYTPHIIQEALSAGYGAITYRNNTELRMMAWHWNDKGTWSDAANSSGYWTSSSELGEPIRYIVSYALPHRGFSQTGGGESMLTDGKAGTYWKSNPYLTSKFTGDPDSRNPQWVIVDLGADKPISDIRINWAEPYAKAYEVRYWVGRTPLGRAPSGEWKIVPGGAVNDGKGGSAEWKFTESPVNARYLQVWMTASSNTCDTHGSGDARNCVGYAIDEIYGGNIDAGGQFVDEVKHSTQARGDGAQTATWCSSVDPWHRESDALINGGRHSGFDLFFTSGLTNNLPAMIPVTLLYGTPEDAAAEIAYLKKRGYPIGYVEMGEEPDGQRMLPDDYAAFYVQWAKAIHQVDPTLKLGGPVFEGINEELRVWPDEKGRTSWTERFVDYLRTHRQLADLKFYSLEHYPFGRNMTWASLYREPYMMSHILEAFRENGLPRDVPIMVTESHIAASLVGPMSTIYATLWLADSFGSFFEAGGAAYYHSPIQPQTVSANSPLGPASWSNFVADRDYNITGYTSPYWAARMINYEWVAHRSGVHQMYSAKTAIKDSEGNLLVTAYAVKRPDGNWSLMLVNKDETHAHTVRVSFEDAGGKRSAAFAGPVEWVTMGSEQYVWHAKGAESYADPDGPPIGKAVAGGPQATYELPKCSVTVLRGKVRGL